MKAPSPLATGLALLLCALAATAAEFAPSQLRDFRRETLVIEHGTAVESYRIWLAETPAQQEQGLMFLTELPPGYGMLFPQATPRPMNMWMKNTYIPLDMLFIGVNGRISHIIHEAVPQSTEILSSGGPIIAVLEIRGGESRRLGLREGDRVVQGTGTPPP
jgi:uncharacterized membrane protein (UPF0127 family)